MTKAKLQTSRNAPPLNDTALVLLSGASDCDDGSVLPPPSLLKAGTSALQRVLKTLLRRGLVEEFTTRIDEQAWRSKAEVRIGLRITAAGLAAIGLPTLGDEERTGPAEVDGMCGSAADRATQVAPAADAIRAGSKQALLVEELRRPEGVRIDDLVGTLGWQSHTVRAALTGLRKRGITVERDRDGEGSTIYRTPPAAAKAPAKRRARSRAGAQA